MTASLTSFRQAFPAFMDPGIYPAHEVEYWMTLAGKLHNADRWGELLDDGIYLFTAHNLALEFSSKQDAARAEQPGQIKGTLTSASVDKVSYSRDGSSATDPTAGHWNLTIYGIRWLRLSRLVGMGPVQIGAAASSETGSMAWPGVIPPPFG